jgi:hypothetical protein
VRLGQVATPFAAVAAPSTPGGKETTVGLVATMTFKLCT